MVDLISRFWHETEGADASEYALLAGLIAVAIITGATSLGTSLGAFFVALDSTVSSLPDP